jgi:hypothetical protein
VTVGWGTGGLGHCGMSERGVEVWIYLDEGMSRLEISV